MALIARNTEWVLQPDAKFPKRHRGVPFMLVSFLTLVSVGYIFFQSSLIFTTPDLTLEAPIDGALLSGERILVKGTTIPQTAVSINEYQIYSDEKGNFEVMLPALKGFHVIDVRVANRIGSEAQVVHRVVVE